MRVPRAQDGADLAELRIFGDRADDELAEPFAAMIRMDEDIGQPGEGDAVGDQAGAADSLALVD